MMAEDRGSPSSDIVFETSGSISKTLLNQNPITTCENAAVLSETGRSRD
jgi:hypothetical protein